MNNGIAPFLSIIIILISIFIMASHLAKSIKSRQLLKSGSNPIRQISNTEKNVLIPYLKIHKLSLSSGNIFQLLSAKIKIEGYSHRGMKVMKMRANGIDIIFPFFLEEALTETNDIEYVVLSGKFTSVAMVVKLNNLSIIEEAENFWQSKKQPLERLISTRPESDKECRARLSRESYLQTAGAFFITLLSLWIAIVVKDKIIFMILLIPAMVGLFFMLLTYFKTKAKNKPSIDIQIIEATAAIVPYRPIQDNTKLFVQFFFGPSYPIAKNNDKYILNSIQLDGRTQKIQAELGSDHSSGHYHIMSSSVSASIEEKYQEKIPRPSRRLLIYTIISSIGLALLYPFLQDLPTTAAQALSFLPLEKKIVYSNIKQLKTNPPTIDSLIQITGSDDTNAKLHYDNNGNHHIISDDIILDLYYDFNGIEEEISTITSDHSSQKINLWDDRYYVKIPDYKLSGTVAAIADIDGSLHLKLVEQNDEKNQQSFAIICMLLLMIIVMFFVLLSFFIPAHPNRKKQQNI